MKKTIQQAGIRILIAPALLFVFFLLNSCMNTNNPTYTKTSTTGTQGANEVIIQGMAFSPVTLTITAGTTVTWTNKDAMTHTVTSDTGLFDSGNIAANGTSSYTFANAGTFAYHCAIHPSMKATVVVTVYTPPTGY